MISSQGLLDALENCIRAVVREELKAATSAEAPPAAPAAAPLPRGRGRPPKAVAEASVAQAPAAPDPFSVPTAVAPWATLDDVRTALTSLKVVTDQATALGVLKKFGQAENLSTLNPSNYGTVVAAAKNAMPAVQPAIEPATEADPFEVSPAISTAKPLTLEDVKAAVVAAQKRTSQDTVQKVVMEQGGKAPKDGGGYGPSLKALPPESFAATVAALQALPATK